MKVLQILHHCPLGTFEGDFFDGWQARYARALLKYSQDYEIESWMPAFQIPKKIIIKRKGITYKAFPSLYPIIPLATNFSVSLLNELRTLYKKEDNIIVHIQGDRDFLVYSLLSLFPGHPFVLQHLGSTDAQSYLRPFKTIEKRAYRNASLFFVGTYEKKKYLIEQLKMPLEKLQFQAIGVDYEIFSSVNKEKARYQLGLPQDRTYILYVGRFSKDKGLHLIIDFYEKYKTRLNLGLILLGGFPNDPLWPLAKKSATHIRGRVSSDVMPLYFSAANVSCLYANELINSFGGIGVSTEESLACGTPVVSTTLRHIPLEDRVKLGKSPTCVQDFKSSIIEVLENPEKYLGCREVSRKYFDWLAIISKTVSVYNDLLKV